MSTCCHADIIVDAYSHATNDRFSNDPNFIASAFDLSGVGQAGDGRWATAISNNVVISAGHFAPSGPLYFYPGNNPSAVPVTRQVTSAQIVGQSDIWVGVLDQPLPSNIAFYPIANQFFSATPSSMTTLIVEDAGLYQGLNAYMFGLSPFDETITGDDRFAYNDQAVGRNRISGYSENVPISYVDNDALVMYFDPSASTDFVTHEAFFQSGDSGGPTFVEIAGQLVLLGTNGFVGTINLGGVDTPVSGINYLGKQASAIENIIQMNAVPEPNAIALLLIVGTTIVLHNRRRTHSCAA
jgi:hypothetical protein